MDASQTIPVRLELPTELYKAIAQQAQASGRSIEGEIISLLTELPVEISDNLESEFAAWEMASDEDWLTVETMLSSNAFTK